jgi:hypothetical protein
MAPAAEPYTDVAVAFPTALLEGDIASARALLAPELKRRLIPDDLRSELYVMFRRYSDREPEPIRFDPEFAMGNRAGRRPVTLAGRTTASAAGALSKRWRWSWWMWAASC